MKHCNKCFCALILLLGLLPGCSSVGGYQVLVCGYSDADTGIVPAYEYSYWHDPVSETDVVPKLTVNLEEKELTGSYERGFRFAPNNYTEYTYVDQENNRFTIDEYGTLTRFVRSKVGDNEASKCSQDEALEIALKFLAQFVDPEDYQITQAQYSTNTEIYHFVFKKYINDIPTADSANISITLSGELYSFNFFMLGRIPKSTPITFDMTQVQRAVTQKLDTICSEHRDKYERIEYKFNDVSEITILENGEIALICDVSVFCYLPTEGSTLQLSERFSFVVTDVSA